MDFDFTIDLPDGRPRQAYRTEAPGLTARISGRDGQHRVKDVSVTGLAILIDGVFTEKESVTLELLINQKTFLRDLKARMIRVITPGLVGFRFEDLDLRSEARLDKLVLEIQKRRIALRKAKSQSEETE